MGGVLAILGFFGIACLAAWGLADRQPIAGAIIAILGAMMIWIGIKRHETEDPTPAIGLAVLIVGVAIMAVDLV